MLRKGVTRLPNIEAQLARIRNNLALQRGVVPRLPDRPVDPTLRQPKRPTKPPLRPVSPENPPLASAAPLRHNVLAGDPVVTDWPLDRFYAGIWQATPGSWAVSHHEGQSFHRRDGLSLLTDAAAIAARLTPGTGIIRRPGFIRIWQLQQTVVKDDGTGAEPQPSLATNSAPAAAAAASTAASASGWVMFSAASRIRSAAFFA